MALKIVSRVAWLLTFVAAVMFAYGVLGKAFTAVLAQSMLTAVALALGAWITTIYLRPPPPRPGMGAAGLVFVAASQFAFILLVWTDAKQEADLWRLWWAAAVPSLAAAHLRALRLLGIEWKTRLGRVAAVSILAHGLLWMALVARKDILSDPPMWYVALIAVAGGVVVGCTVIVFHRWRSANYALPPKLPAWLRYSAFGASQALLFLGGLYVGRITGFGDAIYEAFPSALAGLTDEEIQAQVETDYKRLRAAADGAEASAGRMQPLRARLEAAVNGRERKVLLPEEDDELKATYMTYLSCRSALLRILAIYAGFDAVKDPVLRARCFLLAFGAATLVCESSGRVVVAWQDWSEGRRKLNEPDPTFGIAAGMFDRIAAGISADRNVERFEEMAAYFEERLGGWRAEEVWPRAELDWFEERLKRGIATARGLDIQTHRNWLRRMVDRVKDDAYSPVYAIQSQLSEWIGDTRIVTRKPFISHEQIGVLKSKLEPGDILLERRSFFLSNAFLPGFWPHAALYVGTEEDLRALGIADDPAIKSKLEEFRRPAHDGKRCTVIEAVSEGVIFNSLEHSMHADHVAVLRPRVSKEKKAQAIVKAFGHHGKPYDYEFDFFSADKLVCTEVVYRSYEGVLHFNLQHVMGRDTLPAIEIVRKFARERGREDRELDFVEFLDGVASEGCAKVCGADDFCGSADRAREFQE